MPSDLFIEGRMRHHEAPDWTALEALLGADELCAHFMWMHDVVLEDGTVLHAYKHRWTRCYFHLADDGRAFYYVTGHLYRECDPHTAIKAVFADWECCEPTPEERRALRLALRRAAATAREARCSSPDAANPAPRRRVRPQ
ncbi:MAG TPA: hypothetical protein VFH80_06780 [Solirubrobacteraceae bacterium]|nr:hypothetical protein [Solirubrobacteraceae bacterium]